MQLYPEQQEYITHNGNTTLRGGRQVGKSIAAAERIKRLAKEFPGCTILITSPSERQENYIWEKVKATIGEREWRKRPTLHYGKLKNGSQIFKFPIGKTGILIEGLSSVDFLFIDEAINVSERAMDAILPMLAEPKKRGLGWINLLGNTRGKPEGFFYDSFNNPELAKHFKQFHWSSENAQHISKEFLEAEKKRLGEMRYKMVYLGEFVEFDYKFFAPELLDKVFCVKSWTIKDNYDENKRYFLGIDPARFGRCKAGFVVVELGRDKEAVIVHSETLSKNSIVEQYKKTLELHSRFNFRNIYVDGGGVGGGLIDFLTEKFGRKIVDLNNASRGEGRGTILKEDLYANTLRLMETGKLKIRFNDELLASFKSVNYDGEEFSGKGTDLAEASIRALWSVKESGYKACFV